MSLTVAASRGGCIGAACGPDDGFGTPLVIVHVHGPQTFPGGPGKTVDVEIQLVRDEAILFAYAVLRRAGVHTP